jgi:hypothetical protein
LTRWRTADPRGSARGCGPGRRCVVVDAAIGFADRRPQRGPPAIGNGPAERTKIAPAGLNGRRRVRLCGDVPLPGSRGRVQGLQRGPAAQTRSPALGPRYSSPMAAGLIMHWHRPGWPRGPIRYCQSVLPQRLPPGRGSKGRGPVNGRPAPFLRFCARCKQSVRSACSQHVRLPDHAIAKALVLDWVGSNADREDVAEAVATGVP